MRKQHWYLRGWEYRESPDGGDGRDGGRGGGRLVYTGEMYTFRRTEKELRSLKIRTLLCFVAVACAYAAVALNESFRNEPAWAGAPMMLALIPMIYLGMGAISLLSVDRSMTYRAYHSSVKRLRVFAVIACALFAATCAGQLVHAIPGRSWPYALPGSAVCLLGAFAIFHMHREGGIDIEPPAKDTEDTRR
jgi:hypothetical protein